MRYWINTVSLTHVRAGAAGGFIQAAPGGEARLKRLARGDLIAFYSPRADVRAGESVQRFTAVATITDDAPYAAEDSGEPVVRRSARFLQSTETAVQPLIETLACIRNKKSWGVTFRRGFFEITRTDFETIAAAMGVRDLPAAEPVLFENTNQRTSADVEVEMPLGDRERHLHPPVEQRRDIVDEAARE